MSKLRGLFDEQERRSKLSKKKDVLEQLNSHIDFEFFRKPLNNFFEKEKTAESNKGGRPAYDYIELRSQVSGFSIPHLCLKY